MSKEDFRSRRLDKTQARKLISFIANKHPENIVFSRHAHEEMKNDGLTVNDVWNVIISPASRIAVVVSFSSKTSAAIVTVWRIKP